MFGFFQKLPRLGSWGLVGLLAIALALWMLSGMLGGSDEEPTANAANEAAAKPEAAPFKVNVRQQQAEKVTREIVVNGDTRPDKIINIAAEVEGQVVYAGPRKGARVAAGAVIARIDPRNLEQGRTEADAVVRTRELEYLAAQRLRQSGHVTEADVASRLAALESARSLQSDIVRRIAKLTITAPSNGILEDRLIEAGDYVKVGESVAQLIRIDPLLVAADVSESDIAGLTLGADATAEVQDASLQGKVRFISSLADEGSRTFKVEIAVRNPHSRIPAGLSARVRIPLDTVTAHRIPASLLSLADDGTVGVKHVVEERVVFTPTRIVRADGSAVYVSGLPEDLLLITRGQGFVVPKQPVTAVAEATPNATALQQ